MDRIGIAASKIAKGNIVLYHAYVLLLIFLFASFIFIIAGAAVMLALIIVGYMMNDLLPYPFFEQWDRVIVICMSSLTIAVGFFSAAALAKNFKVKLSSSDKDS